MSRFNLVVAICLLFAFGCLAQASVIAYSDVSGTGDQSFTGNLALIFQVITPIQVVGLGVFNAGGTGTITGTIQVAIFNSVGTEVVGPVSFHGSGFTVNGNDIFQAVGPVTLNPGTYEVDAVGFSATDMNGNINLGSAGPSLNSGAGSLSFLGAAYDTSTSLDNPQTCVGCASPPSPQNQQFDAGTFQFNMGAVSAPEPTSTSLIILGLGAGLVCLRRKRRA